MMELNTVEVAVLALSAAGVAAGIWFLVSARTVQAGVALVAAMVVPVLGPALALLGAGLHLARSRRGEADVSP